MKTVNIFLAAVVLVGMAACGSKELKNPEMKSVQIQEAPLLRADLPNASPAITMNTPVNEPSMAKKRVRKAPVNLGASSSGLGH